MILADTKFEFGRIRDQVVLIDEVPKTSVGKFDKKVLRKRFADYFDG